MSNNEQPAWAAAMERRLVAAIDGGIAGVRGELAQLRRDMAGRLDALAAILKTHRLPRRDAP
jgi:hypothetical protein